MRLLAAFVSIAAMVVSPAVIAFVLDELKRPSLEPSHCIFHYLWLGCNLIRESYTCFAIIVVAFAVLQTIAILFSLYGYNGCHPWLIYPVYLFIYGDIVLLLLFVADCLSAVESDYRSHREAVLGLLLIAAYLAWLVVIIKACRQVRLLRREFVFWDEVDRLTPSPVQTERDEESTRLVRPIQRNQSHRLDKLTLPIPKVYVSCEAIDPRKGDCAVAIV